MNGDEANTDETPLAGLIGGMPEEFGGQLLAEFSRGQAILIGIGRFVLLHGVLSRRPEIGFCGALVIAMTPGFIFQEPLFHVSVEAAIAFLLIHSLRWQETKHKGAMSLRAITAVTWNVHAAAWTHVDGAFSGWVASSAAVVVLAAYGIARLVTGRWGALIVPAGAVISFLAAPVNFGVEKMLASPAGLLAVVGSFVLFALGTGVAVMKDRWRLSSSASTDRIVEQGTRKAGWSSANTWLDC